ncbi:hypothetical protein H2200_007928 [Cladophialophora chaetospira]|uniref:Uncharacterized protein n=1 Tax=Cladophialophora chaetospira TaxID=386627 RepID=A0AA38X6V0_9EURO|nr:hypothetical protein H2200_007928 [Cladophialophora chaetospira]
MGRRPNPLMAEFFTRGAKINDQSNRYRQTCNRCDTVFEKGRNEQMIPHLTKHCPNVTYAERAKIIFRLHDLAVPDVTPYIDPNFKPDGIGSGTQADDLPAGLPTNMPTAMDALVEAATQRVDRNTLGNTGYTPVDQLGLEPELLDPQLGVDGHPITTSAPFEVASALVGGLTALATVGSATPVFPADASVANVTFADGVTAIADVQMYNATQRNFPENVTYYGPAHNESLVPANAADEAPTEQLQSIATHNIGQTDPISEETDPPPSASQRQQKVRGSFAPERRDQVRKMRELGACIRCRMLRKTCSADTPCHTCASVESPRLWKIQCVRTKLDEAFPIYFLMPFTVLTHKELETLKTNAASNGSAGRMEVFHFLDRKITFKARQFFNVYMPNTGGLQPVPQDEVMALDLETDNVLPKVEQYLQAISTELINDEPGAAIRVSLQTAQAIREEQAKSIVAESSDKPDDLISKVIELWLATVVMTDDRKDKKPHFTHESGLMNGRRVIDNTMQPSSYLLLTNQLRAAVEKRASVVCKAVLHQFEQRILRNKCKNFETVLASFILLNCAERMCWLYQYWAIPGKECPLDTHPSRYAEKAESFADLIQMLLNLRHSEPKIIAVSRTGDLTARNQEDTALKNWLTAVGFTSNPTEHFGPGRFTPDNSRSLDGTFSGRLLQTGPAT